MGRATSKSPGRRLPALTVVAVLVATACAPAAPAATGPNGPSGSASPSTPSPSTGALSSGPIDIGSGRHIEIHCSGSGGPVVALDAGLGNTLDVWSAVQGGVAAFTTVCSYDRAGLGGSDERPAPHGAASDAEDLHALLVAAHLPPPYVLVGASFGGLGVQLFARRYSAITAGVVLVDSLATGWDPQLEALLTPEQVEARHAIPNGEPISNDEIRASEVAAGEATPAFPPVPLVVLRHGRPFPGDAAWPTAKVEALWQSLQEGLARLSPTSTLLLASSSSHRIHQDQPDLVVDAIHAIVDPSRWPPTAEPPGSPFGAHAQPVPAGSVAGRIAYSQDDGIHLASVDGSGSAIVVPAAGAMVGEPSLDARARVLAYARRPVAPAASGPQQEQPSEIWVVRIGEGAGRRLAAGGQMPHLSPDGRWVAYARMGHEYLIAVDGGGSRDLGEGGCAIWSPDGAQLAMCDSSDRVFILTVSDGTRRDIATGPGPNDPTAWSPDGRGLALLSTRDGNGEIYLIDVDGTTERRLTTAPGNQSVEAWLPDGLLVTSSTPDDAESTWFLVDPATGDASRLVWMTGLPNPIAYAPAR